jgi:hypothetical protein
VAATSANGEGAWSLTKGRVVGRDFVVRTDHLSKWQLRLPKIDLPPAPKLGQLIGTRATDPGCAQKVTGTDILELSVETTKPSDPVLYACPQFDSGKPSVVVINNRGIGLEFDLPNAATVTSTKGRSLGERAIGPANRLQLGEQWRLVPGGGSITISFDAVPDQIDFTATNNAFVFDLLLGVIGKVPDAVAAVSTTFLVCAHDASTKFREVSLRRPGQVAGALRDVFAACGEHLKNPRALAKLAAAIGNVQLAAAALDSVVHLGEKASIRLSVSQRPTLPKPQPKATNGPCGTVDFSNPGGNYQAAVTVSGFSGSSAPTCSEARDVVRKQVLGKTTNFRHVPNTGESAEQVGKWTCVTVNMRPVVTCRTGGRGGSIVGDITSVN